MKISLDIQTDCLFLFRNNSNQYNLNTVGCWLLTVHFIQVLTHLQMNASNWIISASERIQYICREFDDFIKNVFTSQFCDLLICRGAFRLKMYWKHRVKVKAKKNVVQKHSLYFVLFDFFLLLTLRWFIYLIFVARCWWISHHIRSLNVPHFGAENDMKRDAWTDNLICELNYCILCFLFAHFVVVVLSNSLFCTVFSATRKWTVDQLYHFQIIRFLGTL